MHVQLPGTQLEEGKKLTAVDGLRVLRTLLACRLRPLRNRGQST